MYTIRSGQIWIRRLLFLTIDFVGVFGIEIDLAVFKVLVFCLLGVVGGFFGQSLLAFLADTADSLEESEVLSNKN